MLGQKESFGTVQVHGALASPATVGAMMSQSEES